MTSPFNNASLPEMGEKLLCFDSFVISGHQNPDGDCLGSQLGLAWALRSLGKTVDVILVEDAPLEQGLRQLPGIEDMIPAAAYDKSPDCFVAVDISDGKRLGDALAVEDRCGVSMCIDHHRPKERIFDYLYANSGYAALCMGIWELLGHMGITPDARMAQCLYMGLMTDTGRFQFQNVDAAAFRMAADMVDAGADPALASTQFFQNRSLPSYLLERSLLDHLTLACDGQLAFSYLSLQDFEEAGAVKADAETAIDVLRSLSGVRVACILKEQATCVRGSLRAKDDTDVSRFAELWGGGGHKAAAGFTLHMPLEEAVAMVSGEIAASLSAEGEGAN